MKKRDELAQEKLDQINQQRKWAYGKWLKFNSAVYNSAMKMEEAAFTPIDII